MAYAVSKNSVSHKTISDTRIDHACISFSPLSLAPSPSLSLCSLSPSLPLLDVTSSPLLENQSRSHAQR